MEALVDLTSGGRSCANDSSDLHVVLADGTAAFTPQLTPLPVLP